MKNHKKNTQLEARGCTKNIWVMIFIVGILAVFLVANVSAGITKSFKEDVGRYGKIELSSKSWADIFGWFSDKVKDLELKKNTFVCDRNNCYFETEINLYKEGALIDDIKFLDLRNKNKETNVNYKLFVKTGEKEVDNYSLECRETGKVFANQSKEIICDDYLIGKKTENVYRGYSLREKVPSGNYYIRVEGILSPFQKIDWQIKTNNVWLEEWAVWEVADGVFQGSYASSEEAHLEGLWFKSDGTKMYVVGEGSDTVYQYSLSSAWNVSTATYDTVSKAVATQDGIPSSVMFSPNGSTMYVGGYANDYVYQYTCGTEWVVSSCNYATKSLSTSAVPKPFGLSFNSDGTKFYVSGVTNNIVNQYSCTGAYDISTCSDASVSLAIGGNTFGHFWKSDGSKIYVSRYSDDTIRQFACGTAFDLSTCVYESNLDVSAKTGQPAGLYISSDGSNLYVGGGYGNNGIYQYKLGDAASVSGSIEVTLNAPSNNSESVNTSWFFDTTSVPTAINITNVTLNIWNSTNYLFPKYVNNFTITNNETTKANFTIGSFPFGVFHWNTQACGINLTDGTQCFSAVSNYTFTRLPFEVTAESYSYRVFETDEETFLINITTVNNILSTSISLNYDGNKHFTETNCVDGSCELSKSIDIPLVNSGDSQNKTFFWELKLFSNDGTVWAFNTTSNQQNVSRIFMGHGGGATNTTLNFTAWTENNRTRIVPMSFSSTFEAWLGSGSVKRNQSFYITSINQTDLSINPENRTFYVDAFIEYNKADNQTYTKRNYHFQNASLTNTSQSIKLFLLESSAATSFIQRVVDTSQFAQVGVLIFQQRYYPEDNTYETVSITKTDSSGQSVGFYETETVDYRHLIISQGELLKVTDRGKVFPQTSPYTITFTIGEDYENAWNVFQNISNIISYLTFDNDTNIFTYQWIDTTGTLSWANLTVEKVFANQSNVNFCDKSSQLTAGILTCNISGQNGTFIAKGYIGRSPSVLDKLIIITISAIRDALAQPFLLLWIIFLIAVVGLGLFYPPAGMILTAFVLAFGVMLGVIAISWLFVFAIIFILIWILIEL